MKYMMLIMKSIKINLIPRVINSFEESCLCVDHSYTHTKYKQWNRTLSKNKKSIEP